jgi:tyrosine-protein kinase Etk/Wzc
MQPETAESLSGEISGGRWLIVADTLDGTGGRVARSFNRSADLLLAAAGNRRTVISGLIGATLVALLVSFLIPKVYTAKTQLLPPQQNQSSVSAMLGQFGDLAGLAGKDVVKNPSAVFLTLLRSRTIADRLLERFDLMNVYGKKIPSACRQKLEDRTQVDATKEGVIMVQVEDRDPRRAADLANGYVQELIRLNSTLAISEAGRRRVFFEGQLRQAREQLSIAEDRLKAIQETTGMIHLEAQTTAMIESAGILRAHVALKRAQLNGKLAFVTSQNPDAVRAATELSALEAQVRRMDELGSERAGVDVPISKIPAAGLQYVRQMREVKYHEAVFAMVAKQLEAARIDEGKEGTLIQVIDSAEIPDRKSGPNRWLITFTGGLTGLLLSLGWVTARDAALRASLEPARALRLTALKSLWRRPRWRNGNNGTP